MVLPVVDAGKAMLERLVLWSAEQEWIVSKTLVFVTPGVGLDAKAIELADSIGFDVGTMKVRFVTHPPRVSLSLSLSLAFLLRCRSCWWCSAGSSRSGVRKGLGVSAFASQQVWLQHLYDCRIIPDVLRCTTCICIVAVRYLRCCCYGGKATQAATAQDQ